MGEMPIANYTIQIIGADLIGPLPEARHSHGYALTIIDNCSGWAEAFPVKDKTNVSVFGKHSPMASSVGMVYLKYLLLTMAGNSWLTSLTVIYTR